MFNNFILTGHINKNQIPQILKKSDCLLITLKKGGIDKFTVPGKLSNYMIAKKPILGMINGETLDIIKRSKSGLICKSGDYKNLSKNVIKISKYSNKILKNMGKNAHTYAKKYFDKAEQLKKVETFLNKL